jgi:hypothetical protein
VLRSNISPNLHDVGTPEYHKDTNSVAEPHHFDAAPAPAPGENFDAAPAPTLLNKRSKFYKGVKGNKRSQILFSSDSLK